MTKSADSVRADGLAVVPGGGVAAQKVESIQGPTDFAGVFNVSRETIRRLEIYEGLLRQWQAKINLVAPGSLPAIWHRHFADSAQLLALAPTRRPLKWVDLGSGAGFPGLVIACLLAETDGSSVVLIESDGRKAAFLREVARVAGLSRSGAVEIVASRIETGSNQAKIGVADVVSARALAPLGPLLDLAAPFMGPETVGLFLKGRDVEREFDAVVSGGQSETYEFHRVASICDADGVVVRVKRIDQAGR